MSNATASRTLLIFQKSNIVFLLCICRGGVASGVKINQNYTRQLTIAGQLEARAMMISPVVAVTFFFIQVERRLFFKPYKEKRWFVSLADGTYTAEFLVASIYLTVTKVHLGLGIK